MGSSSLERCGNRVRSACAHLGTRSTSEGMQPCSPFPSRADSVPLRLNSIRGAALTQASLGQSGSFWRQKQATFKARRAGGINIIEKLTKLGALTKGFQ